MNNSNNIWDYLIVTASNDSRASAYRSQLELRRQHGLLSNVRHAMVVADPEGKRVGSGGSTICCLMDVVNREWSQQGISTAPDAMERAGAVLRSLRILIVHAGGDSRRLPAYGPCGKIFIPVPGQSDSDLGVSLFDRIVPAFMKLPPGRAGAGQVVMAAGDALILFDPASVSFAFPGMTALACPDTPEQAAKHGVFCAGAGDHVRLYLQKPSVDEQKRMGAINSEGRTLLDIGIMSFDAELALALFRSLGVKPGADGMLDFSMEIKGEVLEKGVDFYREVCCAMGEQATGAHLCQQARGSGSKWSDAFLGTLFAELSRVPFHLQSIPWARFLHFGTTRQLVSSGDDLRQHDQKTGPSTVPISLNNHMSMSGSINGEKAWVEGCGIHSEITLGGQNVLIGVDVNSPLSLPEKACLDVLKGTSRKGQPVWFVRCHGIADTFKDSIGKGGTFCGLSLLQWLNMAGCPAAAVWDESLPETERSLWNARVFPAETSREGYRNWLWMFDPTSASQSQKKAFIDADRYSAAEVAILADQDDFFARRQWLRKQSR